MKTISLTKGQHASPQEAHEAYCRAAIQYHGEFANFGSHQIKESNNEHHTSPRA